MKEIQNISFHIYDQNAKSENWAEHIEICYVLRGSGLLTINREEQWEIHENDIFVLNLYDRYQMLPVHDGKILGLQIPEPFLRSLYPELDYMKIQCYSFLFGEDRQRFFDEIRIVMADILSIYNKNDAKGELCIRGLVSYLLSELIAVFGKSKGQNQKNNGHEQLHLLTEYIHQHYQEENW